MDVAQRMAVIRRLCSFEGRWPGTDAERRAANDLAAQLREAGRTVEVESTYVHPEYGLTHALHLALAVAGSLTAVAIPPLGFGLVLIAAVSMYLDLNTRFYLARRIFFRRASQNVVSPGPHPDARARVVLCAHYDAAKTGIVFGPRSVAIARRVPERLRLTLGPFRLLFWSLVALLPILGVRMVGVHPIWLAALQVVPTAVLLIGIVLLLDIALSDVVPGANDNASGVATVLSLTSALDREPPDDLDVWILLTGAEECHMEGMRNFVRAHRKELDRETTFFVNIDTVGWGQVRYVTAEGFAVTYDLDGRLVQLCDAIATADSDNGNHHGARPLRHPLGTDALPARISRYPAITITCTDADGLPAPWYHTAEDTPERIEPDSLERTHEFTLALVRQIGREAARRTEREAAAV